MKKYLQGGMSPQMAGATNQFRGLASDLRLMSSKTKFIMTPPSSQGSVTKGGLRLNESSDAELIRVPPPKPQ